MKGWRTGLVFAAAALAWALAARGEALDRGAVEREVAARVYLFGLATGQDKAEEGVDWSRLEGVSADELEHWADCVLGVNHAAALELATHEFDEAGPERRLTALEVARFAAEGDEGREVLERLWKAVAGDLDGGRIPEELRWQAETYLHGAATKLTWICREAEDAEGEAAWQAERDARWAQFENSVGKNPYQVREAEAVEQWREEQRRDAAAAAAWKPGSAAERHYRRGWEWAGLGRLRDAVPELRRAVERGREDGNRALADEAQAVLAEVLGSAGRLAEARAECEAGLEEGSGCEFELLSTLARVEMAKGDTEAFCDTALAAWWQSRAAGGEIREWGNELAARAAGAMSAEHLEVWAELCGERLAKVEWSQENRGEIVGLLLLRWALQEFGHVTGKTAEWSGNAPEEDGAEDGADGTAEAEAAEGGGKRIRDGWKGWAWKTDPAVPEIEREFCALLAGEGNNEWAEWREKWGEEACGELTVDGLGAWAVSLAMEAERSRWQVSLARSEELFREAAEAFRKGKGFCAYRLTALLRGLAECVRVREDADEAEDTPGAGDGRRAADDTEWAEWADWATRAATGWHWAEGDAAWLRMLLAQRKNDAMAAAREAREVLARCGEEAWPWGRAKAGDLLEDALMAMVVAEDWAGVAEALRKAAAQGDETGLAGLCEAADWLDAGTVAGTRELAEWWILAATGGDEESLLHAAWMWRSLDSCGAWTQARLAEMEISGTWDGEEGERFAREAQERNPTLRGAGFLIRRAAARGDAAEAWRTWCSVAADLWGGWGDLDDPAERVMGEELRRRLVEMSQWCGEVPEEVAEEVEEAWKALGMEE